MSGSVDLNAIAEFLRKFASDRDWEQYHTPKNLVMALAGEVGELLDIFQWLTAEESMTVMSDPDRGHAVREEIADVFQYLVRLADILDVNIEKAVWEKLRRNESRFP